MTDEHNDHRAGGKANPPTLWTPLFDNLSDLGLTLADRVVFGFIQRYSQMRDAVCRASVPTMAGRLGISERQVQLSLRRLSGESEKRQSDGLILEAACDTNYRHCAYTCVYW